MGPTLPGDNPEGEGKVILKDEARGQEGREDVAGGGLVASLHTRAIDVFAQSEPLATEAELLARPELAIGVFSVNKFGGKCLKLSPLDRRHAAKAEQFGGREGFEDQFKLFMDENAQRQFDGIDRSSETPGPLVLEMLCETKNLGTHEEVVKILKIKKNGLLIPTPE